MGGYPELTRSNIHLQASLVDDPKKFPKIDRTMRKVIDLDPESDVVIGSVSDAAHDARVGIMVLYTIYLHT